MVLLLKGKFEIVTYALNWQVITKKCLFEGAFCHGIGHDIDSILIGGKSFYS